MKLSKIKTNPSNPRNIRGERLEALKKSVVDDAWMRELREIVVDENMMILGGNMRYQALKAVGIKEVPDNEIKIAKGLTEEQKRRFVILDNASFGDWDFDLLANEWDDLPLADWLDLPDFEAVEAEPIEEDEEAVGEMIDKAEELNKKWKVQTGDLWQIGRHRLLCGDSTKKADVERLMDGEKAQMVFTDPPYGMNLDTDYSKLKGTDKSPNAKGYKYEKVIGDDVDFNPTLILDIFDYCKEIFLWGGDYYSKYLPQGKGWFVWAKRRESDAEMIGNDFEMCWSKQNHKRRIIRIRWVGWDATEKGEKRTHPTQKPVQLANYFIDSFSETNNTVADLFAGSGSTMVACEQLNRKAFLMELSENYCAVILERLTVLGLEAKRIN